MRRPIIASQCVAGQHKLSILHTVLYSKTASESRRGWDVLSKGNDRDDTHNSPTWHSKVPWHDSAFFLPMQNAFWHIDERNCLGISHAHPLLRPCINVKMSSYSFRWKLEYSGDSWRLFPGFTILVGGILEQRNGVCSGTVPGCTKYISRLMDSSHFRSWHWYCRYIANSIAAKVARKRHFFIYII